MEKKQTAVQWLVETINNKIDYIPIKYWDSIKDIVQQALEIEKKQIMDARINGDMNSMCIAHLAKEKAEQYYNKTYKSE